MKAGSGGNTRPRCAPRKACRFSLFRLNSPPLGLGTRGVRYTCAPAKRKFKIERKKLVTIPLYPPRVTLPERLMLLRTFEHVRRLSRIVGFLTLLLIGIVMLITCARLAGDSSRVGVARGGIRLGQAAHGPNQASRLTSAQCSLAIRKE